MGFNFLKSKRDSKKAITNEESVTSNQKHDKQQGWSKRLFGGLKKTRQKLGGSLANLILGSKEINAELIKKIEHQLIAADVGIHTSELIIDKLTKAMARSETNNGQAVLKALKKVLFDILEVNQSDTKSMLEAIADHAPYIVLMVGINGAGKTTSIAKIAKHLKAAGQSVMLAAGDTFRAAAIEQLSHWGEKNDVPVIKQAPGSDSASVIFDAVSSAQAKKANVLLADTAGRLHTQHNLMAELEKIKRVIIKKDASAPHEVMLVIDATLGQNSLQQVKVFHEAMKVDSICITKLDGTAKGGILFAIANECHIPIRFVGVGEALDDLQVFNPKAFVDALFEGMDTINAEAESFQD